MLTYGPVLHRPRLLIVPRVIHENRRTDVSLYEFEHDGGFDLEYAPTNTQDMFEYEDLTNF